MRTKRFRAGAAAGVIAIGFIGGCAAQVKRLEPRLELRDAAQHLADAKQAGFTLKLTGSADDLIAGLKKQAAAGKSGDPDLSADDTKDLRTLFNSSVTVAYDRAGDGAADDRMSLAATVDGITGTEIRLVGKTLYAKAPVTDLAAKLGAGDDLDDIREGAATGVPGLDAFFDGGWVSVDVKDAAGLTGLPAGDAQTGNAVAELKTGARNLFDGASIVRDPADDKHLIVTTSTTKAYAELKRVVTAVGGKEAAGIDEELGKAPTDRPIVLDLWIDNGKFSALEVNVLQFIDGAAGRAAVRLEMTTGTPIEVPAGATKVDPAGLPAAGVSMTDSTTPGTAVEEAAVLASDAGDIADDDGGKPADHLKEAIAELDGTGVTAKIVRRGVAEVTVKGSKACVTLPSSSWRDPKVVKGAC